MDAIVGLVVVIGLATIVSAAIWVAVRLIRLIALNFS